LDVEEIAYPSPVDNSDAWQLPVDRGEDNSSTLPRAHGYISSHSRNEGLPVSENSQSISPRLPPQPHLSSIHVVIVSKHFRIENLDHFLIAIYKNINQNIFRSLITFQ